MLSHFNDIENRIKWFEFYSETFNWNDYNFYRNYKKQVNTHIWC